MDTRIVELAMHDTTIRHLYIAYTRGDMSKEEALIIMVMLSVEQKNHYINDVIKLRQTAKMLGEDV